MNDHQDRENFSYTTSWSDIESMLREAEREQNKHFVALNHNGLSKAKKIFHMRKYKGLQGVIVSLRWVLGDLHISKDKVLGKSD